MGSKPSTSNRFSVATPDGVVAFFRVVAGDVHRYVSRLTGGDRQLAEDIVQDAFFSLLRQSQSGSLDEVEIAWIMTTARNRFIDHVRSRERERNRIDTELRKTRGGEQAPASGPEHDVISADGARSLLASLPEQERWALGLQVVEQLTIKEVAGLLGRSVDATTSLLARARQRLRIVVEADDGD